MKIAAPTGGLRVIAQAKFARHCANRTHGAAEAQAVIEQAKAWNVQHGFAADDQPAAKPVDHKKDSGWVKIISGPLRNFLTAHFPKPAKTVAAAHRRESRRDLFCALTAAASGPEPRR